MVVEPRIIGFTSDPRPNVSPDEATQIRIILAKASASSNIDFAFGVGYLVGMLTRFVRIPDPPPEPKLDDTITGG